MIEGYDELSDLQDGMSHWPNDLWERLSPKLNHNSFAQCAIDMAVWDLYGKKMGKPLYKLWGLEYNNTPKTDYTIGIASIDKMVEKMRQFPFPIYKIKLGTDEDMDIMRAMRRNTDARLRIDANCGWTAGQAILYSLQLKDLNVEFIEQPLPAEDWDAMKEVYKNTVLPLFADEACVREQDVKKCVNHFHGINIKLMKCGGITPALRMIKEARALELQVMMGCMTECSIGISAIAQFLPLLDFVDMDGALLIANDPANGVTINADGSANFPNVNGTGVTLKSMMY
jgi:L-alanine-DL-glutamate epimerase-like enolase superfamily enzyme